MSICFQNKDRPVCYKSYKSRSVCSLWILWERMCCPCFQFFTLWPHNFNLRVTILSRRIFSLGTLTTLNKWLMCDFGSLPSYFFFSQTLGMSLVCIYIVKLKRKTILSYQVFLHITSWTRVGLLTLSVLEFCLIWTCALHRTWTCLSLFLLFHLCNSPGVIRK